MLFKEIIAVYSDNHMKLINTVKVKPSRYRHAGPREKVQLLLIPDFGTRWGERSVSRPGRTLPPRMDPWYPLVRRLGGPQSWSEQTLEEKSFASAGDRTTVM
jgi:hypothetical protein